MLKKTKIIITAATLASVGASIGIPLALVSPAQAVASTPKTQPVQKASGTDVSAKVSYAAAEINQKPGALTSEPVLTPPESQVFTDNVTIKYGAKVLPLPKLPNPAPGYSPWSQSIAYVNEATNEPVTAATLPTLPSGTVVVAIAMTVPAQGHTGPAYVATVRFIIQKLVVRQERAAALSLEKHAVMTTLERGKLPLENLESVSPPDMQDKGFLPWSADRLVRTFIDKGGRSYPLDNAGDWAYLASRFQNAPDSDLFTISYVWQTEPDQNHYADGWDGLVKYQVSLKVAKRATVASKLAGDTNRNVTGSSIGKAVDYGSYVLDGRPASITSMNQFGTFIYDVPRSSTGEPTGGITPFSLKEPELTLVDFVDGKPVYTTEKDGKSYPVVSVGSRGASLNGVYINPTAELFDYWDRRANPSNEYVYADYANWPNSRYVTKALHIDKVSLPGTEFNIFNAIPSDSAASSEPIVSIEYAAADLDAALRFVAQLDISYDFVNSIFFNTPNPSPAIGMPTPTVENLQAFMNRLYLVDFVSAFKENWVDDSAFNDKPFDSNYHLADYVSMSMNTNIGLENFEGSSYFRDMGNPIYPEFTEEQVRQLDPNGIPYYTTVRTRQKGLAPFQRFSIIPLKSGIADFTMVPTLSPILQGPMKRYFAIKEGLAKEKYFNFAGLDRYAVTNGQFFDVADLTFLPGFDKYEETDKTLVRSKLLDPDVTRLKVGAYVEYKNGKLLLYLIPYITSLPKTSFAQDATKITMNRNIGFSYQFQNVKVSLDAKNDSTLGWWS